MVLYASVVFTCSVTFPKCQFPSRNHSQHLLLSFLRHPLENTDVTGCWNHLLACGTPFKYRFPPLLATVEIQMTRLHIIYHRGCVLKLKPSTRSFSCDFIYSISVLGQTENTSRVVFSPLRVCLGQSYGLIQGLYVWKLVIPEKAQEVMFALKAESSYFLVTQPHKPSAFFTQWSSHGILVHFWCTCGSSISSATRVDSALYYDLIIPSPLPEILWVIVSQGLLQTPSAGVRSLSHVALWK